MRSLKINRLLPIYISILPLKFGVDIQSQTKISLETKKSDKVARRPFWKSFRWKSIGPYPYIQVLCHLSLELIFKAKLKLVPKPKNPIWPPFGPFWKSCRWKSISSYPHIQVLCHLSLELIFKAKLKLKSGNQKIQYGCLAAILKLKLLKINRLLHIYISIVLLKFRVEIQSQTKVRVWKPKNPIYPPGGHFESNVAENIQASAYDHHQHAYDVWSWNSKANLTYTLETMLTTESRNRKI